MGIYVVTGATGKYGRAITEALRDLGHEVHEAQRHVNLHDSVSIESWHQVDFENTSEAMTLIQDLLTSDIQVNGIVFAHAVRSDGEVDSLELHTCMLGNVTVPAMTVRYLRRFDRLLPNAKILFLLDRREGIHDLPYRISKDIIVNVTARLLDFDDIVVQYAVLPDIDLPIAQQVSKQVSVMLTDGGTKRIQDLQHG